MEIFIYSKGFTIPIGQAIKRIRNAQNSEKSTESNESLEEMSEESELTKEEIEERRIYNENLQEISEGLSGSSHNSAGGTPGVLSPVRITSEGSSIPIEKDESYWEELDIKLKKLKVKESQRKLYLKIKNKKYQEM